MNQIIYLVVGTPGSGKSWVCNQLKNKFTYIEHDSYAKAEPGAYVRDAAEMASIIDRPVLIETPFSVSQILEPLVAKGYIVYPVFIIETEEITSERYKAREGKEIPKGHLTRIKTYMERVKLYQAFSGTSEEVLKYLQNV